MPQTFTDLPHPLQPCWDLALALVKADALDAALALGLFDRLDADTDVGGLAGRLGLDCGNAGALLDLLWSIGLLTRSRMPEGGAWRYGIRQELAPYLRRSSPTFCGDALAFRLRTLRQFGLQIPELLRQGTPAPSEPEATGWAQAARLQIAQEQHAITVGVALACVAPLRDRLGRHCRFLDLGGGPGGVTIALANANPGWSGVLFDLPETAEVARQAIIRAGLSARLSVRGGDLIHDDIGGGYDLIWCSSVLHFVPDLRQSVDKIHRALAPGGLFVSVHAELSSQREAAEKVLPYYLPLLMRGRQVWPLGGLLDTMTAAGFVPVDRAELSGLPLAPAYLLIGRKETQA